jgi:hypothetical protein
MKKILIALIALPLMASVLSAMWCIPTQVAWYDECTVGPENPGEPPAWCNTLRGRLGHAVMDLLGLDDGDDDGDGESNSIVPDGDDHDAWRGGDPDGVGLD